MKILVADDDAVSSRLMERILQRGGYEVVRLKMAAGLGKLLKSGRTASCLARLDDARPGWAIRLPGGTQPS